ncbi:hypothetical protein GCM10027265_05320 [Jatrophihabitans fulvus]
MSESEPDGRSFDLEAAFAAGLERMSRALGPDVADAARREAERARTKGDAARIEVPLATTWGWLMGRPGLSERDRVIAMLAVDVARGTRRALAEHLQLASASGIGDAELRELFVHLGPYAGYPALNDASQVLSAHLAQRRAAPAGDEARDSGRSGDHGWLGRPAVLHQVSVAVRDAARAADALSTLLGIEQWDVALLDETRAELTVDGRPQDYVLVRAVGRTADGLRIELLEPRRGRTPALLSLLTRGPAVLGAVVAEGAEPPRHPSAPGDVTWSVGGDAVLHSYDTAGALGYRVEVVGPDLAAFDTALGADETWRPAATALLPAGPLNHVGVVVEDVVDGTAAQAAAFGRERWPVLNFSTADGSLTDARFHERPGTESYLSSIAGVGRFAVEVIEPTGGPSRYREEFLHTRGQGIHHLFFAPLDPASDWDELVTRLADHGYGLATDARGWEDAVQYAYVDALDVVGFDLELVHMLRDVRLDTRSAAVMTLRHRGDGLAG